MSKALKGTLYTVIAGIAWGLSGTSGQYLMVHGISALVLTNIRLIIAGLLLILLAYTKSRDKFMAFLKDKSSLFSLLLFSFIWSFSKSISLSFSYSGDKMLGQRQFSSMSVQLESLLTLVSRIRWLRRFQKSSLCF